MKPPYSFLLLITCCLLPPTICFSQEENLNYTSSHKVNKGAIYISWGYSRDWFSKSNIHFTNTEKNYDFTLEKVAAKDRPDFDKIVYAITRGDFAIPQYNYRIGYYFPKKNNMGIEINFDHVKYVMEPNQTLHLKGTIGESNYDTDTLVTPSGFLHLEHTNGANFLMVNFLYRKSIIRTTNNKHSLSLISKSGAGIVIPKTYVVLFGKELDNRFHIAGWVAGIETGLRYNCKNFFLETTVKGAFADYRNVLILPGTKANHSFFTFEAIVTAGYEFGL